jgi:PERQ amino acid-rich with GYF domain-containing protein
VYVPPHLSNASRNGASNEHRYSREQLLQLFKGFDESESLSQALSELYVGGWEPNISNGTSSASWGRRDEHRDSHGADLCWDRDAHILPMGLHDMTEEEKDVSNTSSSETYGMN